MYYLNLDENNYILSIAETQGGVEAEISLDDYDFSGLRVGAYKWENGVLIFDAERYAVLEAAQQTPEAVQSYDERIAVLEQQNASLQEQIDLLLSGVTG